MTRRIVLLNALPLNAFNIQEGEEVMFHVARDSLTSVRGLIKDHVRAGVPVECYIRHPSTVALLSRMLGLNLKISSDLYNYREGDKIIVVSLKKPVRGKEVDVTEDDLDFYIVGVRE